MHYLDNEYVGILVKVSLADFTPPEVTTASTTNSTTDADSHMLVPLIKVMIKARACARPTAWLFLHHFQQPMRTHQAVMVAMTR